MVGYGKVTFTAWNGWWFWGCGSLARACWYDIFIFIAGESPINYPRRRRKRVKLKKESKWKRWLGIGNRGFHYWRKGSKTWRIKSYIKYGRHDHLIITV